MMNLFPNTNFHSLNLDWILEKLRKAVFTVNGQGPDDNGNINLSGVAGVTSVNSIGPDSAGNVTLTPADVGAMPDSYTAPVASVNGQTGAVSLSAASVGAMPANYQPPVVSVNSKTGVVMLNAADVGALPDDYTAPVASVNGQIGAVFLDADDVGALPDTTVIPDRTSQLINDSGYITSQQASAVTSVNGMVGAVVLDADDVGALPDTTVVPTLTSQLVNDSGFITQAQAAPVQSVNSKVGNVVLDASDVGATPAGQGLPVGGTARQLLVKNSADNYDAGWVTSRELLWENPSPSAAFSAQTLNIDVSGFSVVICEWLMNAGHPFVFDGPPMPVNGETHRNQTVTVPDSGNSYAIYRNVTLGNTIIFGDGVAKQLAAGASGVSNTSMIPKQIYGIQ